MKTKPERWWEYADEDLRMSRLAFDARMYRQTIFHCQQALEKALKAFLLEQTEEAPPKTHDLRRLAQVAKVHAELAGGQLDLLADLEAYYMESRYPAAVPGDT